MRRTIFGRALAMGMTFLAAALALAATGELLSGGAYETVDTQVERVFPDGEVRAKRVNVHVE